MTAEHLKRVEIKPGDDVAIVAHSSGTTGLPKAVILTHRNLIAGYIEYVYDPFKKLETLAEGISFAATPVKP